MSAVVAAMANFAAAGSASAFIRLEGSGLPEGPEVISVGAFGGNIATGMNALMVAKTVPLGVKVTAGNEILVFGEMAGADIGQVSFGVTLIFE
jgi:hypothetical protein